MTDSIVTRTIGADFIYLDLIFLAIWITLLIRKKYWIPILWGLLGWAVYLLVDYYIWYIIMKSRTYIGPFNDVAFFLWFCFSPGFVQFSYVALMYEKRNWREIWLWTAIFYIGWLAVGIVSQLIPIDDRIIMVSRDMDANRQRLTFALMAILNLLIGLILYFIKKIRFEDVVYLFAIGTLVEFCLELSLSVPGIRLEQGTWSIQQMIVNTLIEFNMGIVLMFLLWIPVKTYRDKGYKQPISFKDFKYIKTDFNLIAQISDGIDLRRISKNRLKIYRKVDIISDLNYYHDKYMDEPFDENSFNFPTT